ncbi:MAG: Root adhesin [Bacteroidota bacterium]|jgi:hypothetical protein
MVQQQQQNWWWSKLQQLLVLLAGVLLAGNTAVAQTNLVRNPHLDEINYCPNCLGCYNLPVINFGNYSLTSTSDYFNKCTNSTSVGIPNNFGYQMPRSGDGYMHAQIVSRNNQNGFLFWFWNVGFEHARENFFGEFTSPLQAGSYYVEIYTTLAQINNKEIMATNAFDMLLLEDSIYRPFTGSPPHINLQQVINLNPSGELIYDTLNWVKLSTCFEASGGERFFAIGTFRDTLDIQYDAFDHPTAEFLTAPYYFEDVRIFPCENCCSGGNAFPDFVVVSSNPGTATNPTVFNITLSGEASASLVLYDSAGRRVANYTTQAAMSAFTAPSLASGVYHYRFTSSNDVLQTGKFVVE